MIEWFLTFLRVRGEHCGIKNRIEQEPECNVDSVSLALNEQRTHMVQEYETATQANRLHNHG